MITSRGKQRKIKKIKEGIKIRDQLITNDKIRDCFKCGNEVEDWESEFNKDQQYKVAECDCGYKLRMRVEFDGSGHDEFRPGKKESIEDLLAEAK